MEIKKNHARVTTQRALRNSKKKKICQSYGLVVILTIPRWTTSKNIDMYNILSSEVLSLNSMLIRKAGVLWNFMYTFYSE